MNEPVLYATSAQVHLDHIEANLRAIRERVGDRFVLVAVKANAYGHGAAQVASMIERTGVADWLGVATVPEALELRAVGISIPILKLSQAFPEELVAAVEAGVVLTVVDEASADAAQQAAASVSTTAEVHVKVDTGMRRIGVEPPDAPALAAYVARQPNLHLTGIFTHLPVSDTPLQDPFTEDQSDRFADVVGEVEAAIGAPLPYVHAANSGGVLAHPSTWHTMVRPGIMAYGSYPDPATPRTVDLLPGLSLTTRVSYVKRVRQGETVGYGRTWTAPADTTIVTIPVGYGDGYSRLLSNRGEVLIGGSRRPIAGRVCMDQTMVDVGDDPVRVGDPVTLIGTQGGQQITASDVAAWMGTIPYEVTCLLTDRVTRTY